jgi:hypothetical protein
MLEGIGYNNSNQNFIVSKVYREQGAASFEDALNEKMKRLQNLLKSIVLISLEK